MKNKFRSTLDKIVFGASILVASAIAQESQAQIVDWRTYDPLPTEKVNLFSAPDTTIQASKYNKINTEQRDIVLDSIISADWIKKIIPNTTSFACVQFSRQTVINNRSFGKNLLVWEKPIYGGYDGLYKENGELDLDSLYFHGGTLAEMGKNSLPVLMINFTIPTYVHAQVGVFTGNSLSWDDLNIIEPQYGITKVQPGQHFLPTNCEEISLYYYYTYDTPITKNNLTTIKVAAYKLENGKATLLGINPNIEIYTERDTTSPTINIEHNFDPSIVVYNTSDTESKITKVWYTIDDGAKTSIEQEGTIQLNLDNTTRKITIGAENDFRLTNTNTTYRNSTGIETLENPIGTLTIYPNPFTDHITLTDTDQTEKPVVLLDMIGRELFRTNKTATIFTVSDPVLKTLNPGTYILQVGDYRQKVVKTR